MSKSFLLLSIFASSLAACERPMGKVSHGLPVPQQTYSHVETLRVNVADILILQDKSNVERPEGFKVDVANEAIQYLSQKFKAIGDVNVNQERLVVNIETIEVTKRQKSSRHGVLQRLNLDKSHLFDIRLVLRLEHVDALGSVKTGSVLTGTKQIGLSEHLSPAAREQRQFEAIEDLFRIIDPEVNRVIHAEMNL